MSEIQGKCDNGRFIVKVLADSSGVFVGNGLKFDTKENAEAYARDLFGRWTAVREWKVLEQVETPSMVFDKEVSRG